MLKHGEMHALATSWHLADCSPRYRANSAAPVEMPMPMSGASGYLERGGGRGGGGGGVSRREQQQHQQRWEE